MPRQNTNFLPAVVGIISVAAVVLVSFPGLGRLPPRRSGRAPEEKQAHCRVQFPAGAIGDLKNEIRPLKTDPGFPVFRTIHGRIPPHTL